MRLTAATLSTLLLLLGACACEDVTLEREQPDLLTTPDSKVAPPRPDVPFDTREPDTREPDTREPDTREPDTREPDTREPDTREPDTREPDVFLGCDQDRDCADPRRPICDRQAGLCVGCLDDQDCPSGAICNLLTELCEEVTERRCETRADCRDGQLCSNFDDPSFTGSCTVPCTPYVDPDASGCPADSWCAPDYLQPAAGLCTPSSDSTTGSGEVCSPGDSPSLQGSCADGHACLPDSAANICYLYCDPDASDNTPGSCGSGSACVRLGSEDEFGNPIETAYGVCLPSCDRDAGIPCEAPDQTCVPGSLYELDSDLCTPYVELDVGERCDNAGLVEGDFCGDIAVCLDLSDFGEPGVRCHDLCITSNAPFGPDHPDCRRLNATCEQVFPTTDAGLCL